MGRTFEPPASKSPRQPPPPAHHGDEPPPAPTRYRATCRWTGSARANSPGSSIGGGPALPAQDLLRHLVGYQQPRQPLFLGLQPRLHLGELLAKLLDPLAGFGLPPRQFLQ
ncbi:hypothetical protein [Streptosporangium sp. NPDC087985]|uniref:hypothetical protein n=1 Tax=Streptosporangium sp. NPDC087985 TaxID=3366196 RepID=UPI0038045B5C